MKKQNVKTSAKESIDPDIFEKKININRIGQGDSFTGFLCNLKPFKANDEQNAETSCLLLYFIDEKGDHYKSIFNYEPYFYLIVKSEMIFEFQQFISRQFDGKISTIEIVEKNDLDMVNHLSGLKLKLLKLNFKNISNLVNVRNSLRPIVQKNKTKEKILYYSELLNPSSKIDMMDMIQDLREDDVPYHVRVCIDNEIRCGLWYQVRYDEEAGCRLKCMPEKLGKADLRVLAFDIETTKAPLKFPDSRIDSIMLISYMVDGHGYLITNRTVISEDIADFEYCPKPEFDGYFHVFNEVDEKGLLERFALHCKELRPNVFVTFNGDYFDIPFIMERMKAHNLNMESELGIANTNSTPNASEREFMGRFSVHIDCMYWVKRDAFLPQGSHGLKAVTKAKLGYDPIEVDPEKMLSYAKNLPQQLCAYSVSDALATYYLYKLMIHDFIYALCTIIPTFPDEVLRKGSGTLCEELLMAQAFRSNIIFPNKQVDEFEKFYSGHLIDSQTYIGGHVECLNVGVYRSDIPVKFKLDPTSYEYLMDNIENYIKFCIKIENNMSDCDLSYIENFDLVVADIKSKLSAILHNINESSTNTIELTPLIYHLDVSAMYPNIILTNRLQPVSVVDEQICAGCQYNREENDCKRYLNWQWKGELFPLARLEYENLKHQYEFELLNKAETDKEIEELTVEDHRKKFLKRIKNYCQKVYKQVHLTKIELKEDIVCMRENSFYVDTVRDFRDRRYEFKNSLKIWKGKLEEARSEKNFIKIEEAKNMMNLYESLQLAHKIILNSFYGYVMRRGARWHSMEMAAMVTHVGSLIIMDSRELVERLGKPLELDTDGIWCLLPMGFPENFQLKLKNNKKINLSFPCTMLNYLIYEKYCNKQYQKLDRQTGAYITQTEMSIFFEVDGPYRCMVIPAAKEEGKMLKKRYAVFGMNGKLHELKGFELKRRGELKIIKIFQSEVFDFFLKGNSLKECYSACAEIGDRWYSILENKGLGITDDELLDYIAESRVMSKSITEYGAQKSTSITCAKRLADLLGSEIVKDKGLCTKYIISKKPHEAPVAERAVPTVIFYSDPTIKRKMLRKWLKDFSLEEVDMRDVIDWDYYKDRLAGTILKILIIPAAIQKIENPLPKIAYPDWLNRLKKYKSEDQKSLKFFFKNVSNVDKFLSIAGNGDDGATENETIGENRNINESAKKSTRKEMSDIQKFLEKGKAKNQIKFEENPKVEEESEEMITPVNMLDDFTSWLKNQKKKWNKIKLTNRSHANGNLMKNPTPFKIPSNPLFSNPILMSQFINKEQIFRKSAIKILQILEYNPGTLKLWISYDSYFDFIFINIKRKIYINSHKSDVPDIFKPTKLSLPRGKPMLNLYEFDIEEKDFKEKFNNFNDYIIDSTIEGVYETKVPSIFRAIQEYGCQIRFINKTKKLNTISGNTFNMEDFESKPVVCGNSLNKNYLEECEYSKYFIYHSNLGARHFFALFLLPLNKVNVYIINTITRNMEVPNIKKIMHSVLEAEGHLIPPDFEINTFVEPDIRIVLKNVNKIVYDLKHNNNSNNFSQTLLPSTSVIVLQSCYKLNKLISLGLNCLLNEYPVLEIPFYVEENSFPALDWIKFAVKKLALRYVDLNNVIDYRMQLSKYCNIPLCNMENDASIFCTDVFFSRMLKSSKQILWYSPSGFPDLGGGTEDRDFLGEIESEFPKVINPGMYLGYTVEIDIGLFCVNAILESDHMKDIAGRYELNLIDKRNVNDIPSSSGTHVIDYHLERDEFVLGSNAFIIIKRIVEKWLLDVRQYENVCADLLLVHFFRWVSSFNSKFFDPVLHRMIIKLMQKYFSILLRKIKDFGFYIVYADYKKIYIFNNKSDFSEFQANIDYLFRTIKKIQIFNHITLTPNTFWKILLFKDNFNYAGINATMYDESNQAQTLQDIVITNELAYNAKVVSKWTIAEFLPPILEKDLISLVSDYILKLYKFSYFKDYMMVANIMNLYLNKDMSEDDAIQFINQEDSVKKFKRFLINDYLSQKVFNIIPNIIKKKDERYEDEELENFDELNLKDEEYENIKTNIEDKDQLIKPLFSKKDFMDDDYDYDENPYEKDNEEEYYDNNHKKIVNAAHTTKTPIKDKIHPSDHVYFSEKLDYSDKLKRRELSKMWEFPVKLGSHHNLSDLALEYIKYITAILELDEDITQNAFVLKKNTLRLIKVEEFSQETYFEDPCRNFILHDVICEFCSNNKDFDFCRDKQILSNTWACDLCHSHYDKQFIEFLIIHKIKNIIDFYYNQDLKCKKCKMQKNELIFTSCKCAGDFIRTFEENIFKNVPNIKSIEEYLDNIFNIANYYQFDTLKAMLNQFRPQGV